MCSRSGVGTCIFDVGANRGQFLQLALRKLSGRRAVIHSFEPGRDAFATLRAVGGTLPDVRLNIVALGRARGSGTPFSDTPGSGLASMTRRRLEHHRVAFRLREPVTIETLDDYWAGRPAERIDLLRVDVEGHELDVLCGAARTLGAARIDFVPFEVGGSTSTPARTFATSSTYSKGRGRVWPASHLPAAWSTCPVTVKPSSGSGRQTSSRERGSVIAR